MQDKAPDLGVIIGAISKARYEPFVAATGKDLDRAWQLYCWNSEISGALLERIGFIEVPLRNAMHRQLCDLSQRRHKTDRWFDALAGDMTDNTSADLDKAKARIAQRGVVVTPGRVVAELNLGFWRYLLTERYSRSWWNPGGMTGLRGAFGPVSDRTKADRAVTRMYELRNRVAHHEPVIKFTTMQLGSEVDSMTDLMNWVAPDLGSAVDPTRLTSLLASRP